MAELTGNNAIESAAIEWVMTLERAAGRVPTDTRYRDSSADIQSPPRLIEVKACGKGSIRGESLALEKRQVEEGRRNPRFYLYVVENVRQGNPDLFTLKVLHGQRLRELLARAKPWGTMDVPFPVGTYDSAPTSTEVE
jgi:hypothetical protein